MVGAAILRDVPMRRRRKLSAEETELWSRVAATTQPARPIKIEIVEAPHPIPHVMLKKIPPAPKPDLREFRIGQSAQAKTRHDLAPSIPDQLKAHPLQMDHKVHQKMTRGRIDPEAKIDLHGMTVNEAHPELIRFILNAQDRGRRLVLVITGKGKPSVDHGPIPVRQGVLRHQVPHWLRLPPLAHSVLQVTQAHLKHGGTGAYYVYLRRL